MRDRKLVLVVDDDPVALEVAQERLEHAGYEVQVRGQALGTSPWILNHEPDFVLLDVMMPALSGSELAMLITKRGVKTSIILHSSMEAERLDELVTVTRAKGAVRKTHDEESFIRQFDALTGGPRRTPKREDP